MRYNNVRIVLDQHVLLDLYCAISLKQQSAGRHAVLLQHIILILSQPIKMRFPVIYTTLNNNSVLLWCSVLLAEEIEVPTPDKKPSGLSLTNVII